MENLQKLSSTVSSNVQILHTLIERIIRADESKEYVRLSEISLMAQEVAGTIASTSKSITELKINQTVFQTSQTF